MEQSALQKEKCRLDLAAAALEASGMSEKIFLLGEIPPRDRRIYFYAVPDAHAHKNGFGISGLVAELRSSDVPHAVDWDRESETFGLRYMPDHVRAPATLRSFSGPEAKAAWSKWRSVEREIDKAVLAVAEVLAVNPRADLDLVRQGQERGVEVKGRKRSLLRRTDGDERS